MIPNMSETCLEGVRNMPVIQWITHLDGCHFAAHLLDSLNKVCAADSMNLSIYMLRHTEFPSLEENR
jgi:hypothetical protein